LFPNSEDFRSLPATLLPRGYWFLQTSNKTRETYEGFYHYIRENAPPLPLRRKFGSISPGDSSNALVSMTSNDMADWMHGMGLLN
jgi:hypothetical protein